MKDKLLYLVKMLVIVAAGALAAFVVPYASDVVPASLYSIYVWGMPLAYIAATVAYVTLCCMVPLLLVGLATGFIRYTAQGATAGLFFWIGFIGLSLVVDLGALSVQAAGPNLGLWVVLLFGSVVVGLSAGQARLSITLGYRLGAVVFVVVGLVMAFLAAFAEAVLGEQTDDVYVLGRYIYWAALLVVVLASLIFHRIRNMSTREVPRVADGSEQQPLEKPAKKTVLAPPEAAPVVPSVEEESKETEKPQEIDGAPAEGAVAETSEAEGAEGGDGSATDEPSNQVDETPGKDNGSPVGDAPEEVSEPGDSAQMTEATGAEGPVGSLSGEDAFAAGENGSETTDDGVPADEGEPAENDERQDEAAEMVDGPALIPEEQDLVEFAKCDGMEEVSETVEDGLSSEDGAPAEGVFSDESEEPAEPTVPSDDVAEESSSTQAESSEAE